jgi:hypothetical protein
MRKFNGLLLLLVTLFYAAAPQAAESGKYFDRVITVIFENTNYSDALAQPFFKKLATGGANFSNFLALAHPSQGNYIALTSASLNGVTGDGSVTLNVPNVIDLLEAKGLTWKVYAENYPGGCYTGAETGRYVRKHNPFISYADIQKNPARCAHIVEAAAFDSDAISGTLPNYVFYIPNLDNDAHDTGVAFADRWYSGKFSRYIVDPNFMARTILVSTSDESGASAKNQIYTSIFGPSVRPGNYPASLNIVSLLKLVETNWNLGNLGKGDMNAPDIPNIWQ